MKHIEIKRLKEIIKLFDQSKINEIEITTWIFNELYDLYKLDLASLFLKIQDRHAKSQKREIGNLKHGLHYSVCALKYKYKKIPRKDLPLLFPVMLAHFENGIRGYSQAEIEFFNRFKESYLENRSDFTEDWLKSYGYDVIVDQFKE